jgi:circadian clock protein KaiB
MTNATNGSAEGKAPSGSLAGQESDEDAASWPEGHYNLRLYIAGQTAKSAAAIANLRRLCEDHLADCHTVEVIDLSKDPGRAAADQIVALPTLVRRLPPPIKRIIGSLADIDKVLLGLEIESLKP